MSASLLRERLRFQYRPVVPDDGYGNREGDWRDMFTEYARVRPLVGSETVIAQRLSGIQPVRITVRSTPDTRDITNGWRAIDVNDDRRIFNVTSPPANLDERNYFLDIAAEIGTPT